MRKMVLMAALFAATSALAAETKPAPKAEAKPAPKAETFMEKAAAGKPLWATIETNRGNIVLELFSKDAPVTVENFVGLATGEKPWTDPKTGNKVTGKPLYDGTVFHRVIPGFMIQGGDPLGNGTGGPGYKFQDEFQSGRKFDKPCILAMANSGPNTNGSQFFVTEVPTPHLNNHHTIFGEVTKGCELVGQITHSPRDPGDRPKSEVVVKHIAISDKAP